ncbi:MAG: DUF2085 domain-containing protein [Anaerolineae bacterium]|jgi:uncharacterized membrane protein
MMDSTRPPGGIPNVWVDRITYWLTAFARWFGAHWLSVANTALALYIGLPVLAALLMNIGAEVPARIIYTLFRPLCHQMPERSFFLFGEQITYSYEYLSEALGGAVPHRYMGNAELGFKIAVCQRDVAIYGSALLGGLLFAGVRRYLRPLPLRWAAVMTLPMAVDGLGQLFGLWSSTWVSRVITGSLFGLMLIWVGFPHLERGMREVEQDTSRTLAQLRVRAARGDESQVAG